MSKSMKQEDFDFFKQFPNIEVLYEKMLQAKYYANESKAFKMWNKFKNPDFPEKYCHFSGELSNGETSVNKPILSKNWRKAKERFNL